MITKVNENRGYTVSFVYSFIFLFCHTFTQFLRLRMIVNLPMLHSDLFLIQNTAPAVTVTTTVTRTHTVVVVVAADAVSSELLPVCVLAEKK